MRYNKGWGRFTVFTLGETALERRLRFYWCVHMGRFREVLASSLPAGEAMAALRRFCTPRNGLVLNTEQARAAQLKALLRRSWDDGRSEDLFCTRIDRSL